MDSSSIAPGRESCGATAEVVECSGVAATQVRGRDPPRAAAGCDRRMSGGGLTLEPRVVASVLSALSTAVQDLEGFAPWVELDVARRKCARIHAAQEKMRETLFLQLNGLSTVGNLRCAMRGALQDSAKCSGEQPVRTDMLVQGRLSCKGRSSNMQFTV